MDATVVDFDDNRVDLIVKEEDISVMHILQHELLKNNKIEFAGVVIRHDLMKECEMRILTKTGNPLDALIESTNIAHEYIENLAQLIKKTE